MGELAVSIRSIPLIAIALIIYAVVVLLGGEGVLQSAVLPEITMPSGGTWKMTWSDLIILVTLVLLFIEIVKATFTSSASLVDHGLSMLVFVACLLCFLLVKQMSTSTFFLITAATLIDVIAGYTIGIRVAKRDIGFGSGDN